MHKARESELQQLISGLTSTIAAKVEEMSAGKTLTDGGAKLVQELTACVVELENIVIDSQKKSGELEEMIDKFVNSDPLVNFETLENALDGTTKNLIDYEQKVMGIRDRINNALLAKDSIISVPKIEKEKSSLTEGSYLDGLVTNDVVAGGDPQISFPEDVKKEANLSNPSVPQSGSYPDALDVPVPSRNYENNADTKGPSTYLKNTPYKPEPAIETPVVPSSVSVDNMDTSKSDMTDISSPPQAGSYLDTMYKATSISSNTSNSGQSTPLTPQTGSYLDALDVPVPSRNYESAPPAQVSFSSAAEQMAKTTELDFNPKPEPEPVIETPVVPSSVSADNMDTSKSDMTDISSPPQTGSYLGALDVPVPSRNYESAPPAQVSFSSAAEQMAKTTELEFNPKPEPAIETPVVPSSVSADNMDTSKSDMTDISSPPQTGSYLDTMYKATSISSNTSNSGQSTPLTPQTGSYLGALDVPVPSRNYESAPPAQVSFSSAAEQTEFEPEPEPAIESPVVPSSVSVDNMDTPKSDMTDISSPPQAGSYLDTMYKATSISSNTSNSGQSTPLTPQTVSYLDALDVPVPSRNYESAPPAQVSFSSAAEQTEFEPEIESEPEPEPAIETPVVPSSVSVDNMDTSKSDMTDISSPPQTGSYLDTMYKATSNSSNTSNSGQSTPLTPQTGSYLGALDVPVPSRNYESAPPAQVSFSSAAEQTEFEPEPEPAIETPVVPSSVSADNMDTSKSDMTDISSPPQTGSYLDTMYKATSISSNTSNSRQSTPLTPQTGSYLDALDVPVPSRNYESAPPAQVSFSSAAEQTEFEPEPAIESPVVPSSVSVDNMDTSKSDMTDISSPPQTGSYLDTMYKATSISSNTSNSGQSTPLTPQTGSYLGALDVPVPSRNYESAPPAQVSFSSAAEQTEFEPEPEPAIETPVVPSSVSVDNMDTSPPETGSYLDSLADHVVDSVQASSEMVSQISSSSQQKDSYEKNAFKVPSKDSSYSNKKSDERIKSMELKLSEERKKVNIKATRNSNFLSKDFTEKVSSIYH